MGRNKKHSLPIAPWIFVQDPTPDALFVAKLTSLIPRTLHISLDQSLPKDKGEWANLAKPYKAATYRDTVLIFSDNRDHGEDGVQKVTSLRTAAIDNACNFTSINLHYDSKDEKKKTWGMNHLDIKLRKNSHAASDPELESVGAMMYQWLFKAFKIKETLHLFPDEKLRQVDETTSDWFPEFTDYEYCPIGEIRNKPKDAKIQIVAVVLSKPTIQPGKKLSWQVVDKTGVANFYFQHRGPSSDYTWDWVLALKPGQRKCLPRMPYVKVKENPFMTIAKTPLRITGAAVEGTGRMVRVAGRGLYKAGKKMKMGSRVTWVLEADYEDQRKSKATEAKNSQDQSDEKSMAEKAGTTWKDNDSVASTTAGSVFEEKKDLA